MEGKKFNQSVHDEVPINDSVQKIVNDAVVIVLKSSSGTSPVRNGEHKEDKEKENNVIKFEKELFEFDAGSDFEEEKENVNTTLTKENNLIFNDTDLPVDEAGCSSIVQTEFQRFLDNALTEEEEEHLLSDNIFNKVFGFSSANAHSEEIAINVENNEEDNVIIVSDDIKERKEELSFIVPDKEIEEEGKSMGDLSNLEKEEEDILIRAMENVFYNGEAENRITVTNNVKEEEKKHLNTLSKKEEDNSNKNDFARIGHRYVNLGHVTNEILRLTCKENRHKNTCVNGQWELLEFTDKGEMTYIYLKCNECSEVIRFLTHPNDENSLNPNYSYVLGCLTAGIGCFNAEEMRAAQGVRTMSAKTFRKYQEDIYLDSLKTSKKCMEESAKKEMEIARKKGHVTETGIPYIAVKTDGSWSKRSYKGGGYNALGCCAVVIGVETGNVIDIVIRTKVCATCDRAEREGREPKEHICLQNYERSKSSGGMEKSAIVEAFTSSIEKYGLIYNILISDGDSSVYKGILDANPYKDHDIIVKKYGCTCHISKNLCKALQKFAAKRDPEEIRGDGGLQARKLLDKNILNIRYELLAAATRRRLEDSSFLEKTQLLCEDISNIVNHVFGEHKNCLQLNFPCGGKLQEGEENMLPLLKDSKKLIPIQNIVMEMCKEAKSLLKNGNTNQCECFNNNICKATGGKRTNLVGQKGYAARCNLQVLQSTKKGALSTMYEELDKKIPEVITVMEYNRQLQVIRNREYVQRKDTKSNNRNERRDKDYGRHAQQPDVTEDIYEILCNQHFKKLKENQLQREKIFKDTLDQYKSNKWGDLRSIMITASRMYDICSKRETTSCESLVTTIVHSQGCSKESNVPALQYGLENEKNALRDLDKELPVKIRKSGLIIDPEEEIFAASPDGLLDIAFSDLNVSESIVQKVTTEFLYSVIPGGIVEIKCPITAQHLDIENAIKINDILRYVFDKKNSNHMNRKHKHYYQVQGQLHVSRREYCLFAMWSTMGIKKVIIMRNDHFWRDVMESKLKRFYNDCLLPEIVDSRKKRDMPIREPDYVKKAIEKKEKLMASNTDKKKDQFEVLEIMPNESNVSNDEQIISDSKIAKKGKKRKSTTEVINLLQSNEKCSKTKLVNNSNNASVENLENLEDDDVQITAVFKAPSKKVKFNNKLFDKIPLKEFQNTILSSSYLDTVCINRFLNVMRRAFKNYEFLNCQILLQQQYLLPFKGELSGEVDIQIIGGNKSGHWRCLYFDGSYLNILDSLYLEDISDMPYEERSYIQKRYPNLTMLNKIRYPFVTFQPDGNSCGVYAAANMVTILLGEKPWEVEHSPYAFSMRMHYLRIIATEHVTHFPIWMRFNQW